MLQKNADGPWVLLQTPNTRHHDVVDATLRTYRPVSRTSLNPLNPRLGSIDAHFSTNPIDKSGIRQTNNTM